MGECGNGNSDLCNPNCGTLDCHSHGCVINNSYPPNTNSGKPVVKAVDYFGWTIPVGISEEVLDSLAAEISSEKKIDKTEVLNTVRLRLSQLDTKVSNPLGVGA